MHVYTNAWDHTAAGTWVHTSEGDREHHYTDNSWTTMYTSIFSLKTITETMSVLQQLAVCKEYYANCSCNREWCQTKEGNEKYDTTDITAAASG